MNAEKRRQPGLGWKALRSGVYEHSSGVRVHMIGLARYPAGNSKSGNCWPESARLGRAIDEQGGNRKRGLMVWAL